MGFIDGDYCSKIHACLIYSSEQQRRSIIEKFIIAAAQDHDRVEYFYDEWPVEEIRQCFSRYDVNIEALEKNTQIRFLETAKAYHPKGFFSADLMWQSLCELYQQGIADGFNGVRLSGEMSWSLKSVPGSEQLIKYESGINRLLDAHPMLIICQYDANRFDGATLMNVLQVHPYMIVQGRLVNNPYYEEFSVSIDD